MGGIGSPSTRALHGDRFADDPEARRAGSRALVPGEMLTATAMGFFGRRSRKGGRLAPLIRYHLGAAATPAPQALPENLIRALALASYHQDGGRVRSAAKVGGADSPLVRIPATESGGSCAFQHWSGPSPIVRPALAACGGGRWALTLVGIVLWGTPDRLDPAVDFAPLGLRYGREVFPHLRSHGSWTLPGWVMTLGRSSWCCMGTLLWESIRGNSHAGPGPPRIPIHRAPANSAEMGAMGIGRRAPGRVCSSMAGPSTAGRGSQALSSCRGCRHNMGRCPTRLGCAEMVWPWDWEGKGPSHQGALGRSAIHRVGIFAAFANCRLPSRHRGRMVGRPSRESRQGPRFRPSGGTMIRPWGRALPSWVNLVQSGLWLHRGAKERP